MVDLECESWSRGILGGLYDAWQFTKGARHWRSWNDYIYADFENGPRARDRENNVRGPGTIEKSVYTQFSLMIALFLAKSDLKRASVQISQKKEKKL